MLPKQKVLFIIAVLSSLLSCSSVLSSGDIAKVIDKPTDTISVIWSHPKQTISGNGINFEGYHTSGGSEVLSSKFENMLSSLPSQLVRISMPLKLWEKDERKYWGEAPKKYGTLLYKMMNIAEINGFQPWYGNIPSPEYPYRYVSKHLMEAFQPGTQIVESFCENPDILVTAGKLDGKFTVVAQNITEKPIEILFHQINLPPNSLSTIIGTN